MADEEHFSNNDGIICKSCKQLFSFQQSREMFYGLQFPKRDFSSIMAKCPNCRATNHYIQNDIKRASKGESELVKELRGRISQLEIDKTTLTSRLEECMKLILNNIAQTKASPIENQTSEEVIKKQNGEGIYG